VDRREFALEMTRVVGPIVASIASHLVWGVVVVVCVTQAPVAAVAAGAFLARGHLWRASDKLLQSGDIEHRGER
jgi:hypothetical protein